MTSRRTEPLGRIYAAVLFAALSALILLSAYQKQHWDSDIFWALKSGEWIADNLRVPDADPFSYTFGGMPWVDFTWGFQVISYLSLRYLGWAGLFLLQAITVSALFLFVYLNLRLLSKRVWLTFAVVFLVFAGAHTRLFIRPHLFEYFFVSLYLLLLNLYEERGRVGWLLLLLPLQVLWINIHSSAILGIFIAGAYAAGSVIDSARKSGFALKSDFPKKTVMLILASVVLPVVSVINPYGLKLAIFPFIHQSADNNDAIRHIAEWTRPHLKELFFYVYPFPLDALAFKVLAIGAVVALLLNLKRIKSRDIFLLAAAMYMALTHVRWLPLFVFFAGPVLAANLSARLDSKGDVRFLKPASILLTLFFASIMLYDFAFTYRPFRGLGLKRGVFPEGTVNFMKKEHLKGNIYNEYVFGGYLIYFYPEIKAFIDGRTPTVYSPYFFWTTRLVEDPARWKRLVGEHGINMALLKLSDPFCGKLREDKDWVAVSFDDVSVLYLKRAEGFDGVISRWGMEKVNACSNEARYKLPDEGLNVIREDLLKAVSSIENDKTIARPHRLLGLVDSRIGGEYLDEAAVELKKALSADPDAYTYYDYGVALGKLKRRDEAMEAFRRSVGYDKKFADGYLGLGLAYFDLKDYRNSICYLKKYISLADDRSEAAAYKALGVSYFETSDFASASAYLKRAAFMTDDKKELGDIYYRLGNSLIEGGGLEEAGIYYRKAMDADPEYKKVLIELANSLRHNNKAGRAEAVAAALGPEGLSTGAKEVKPPTKPVK
ncbi:MAG: tetratricopeptide repeat protein [Deltaproteobacteria bacterium]|nr:tetratricopeptide repeat protein [Deltaproteobacteria bacterium]